MAQKNRKDIKEMEEKSRKSQQNKIINQNIKEIPNGTSID
jgi:hypothetical protein